MIHRNVTERGRRQREGRDDAERQQREGSTFLLQFIPDTALPAQRRCAESGSGREREDAPFALLALGVVAPFALRRSSFS